MTRPDASKSVKLLRHVQSYGVGRNRNRHRPDPGHLLNQSSITTNGTQNPDFRRQRRCPGGPLEGPRERAFSVFSLDDTRGTIRHRNPSSPRSSSRSGRWRMERSPASPKPADPLHAAPGSRSRLNDLYPDSTTYAQVYKGESAARSHWHDRPGIGRDRQRLGAAEPCARRQQL